MNPDKGYTDIICIIFISNLSLSLKLFLNKKIKESFHEGMEKALTYYFIGV